MGLTDETDREGIPEEIEDELTTIEDQAYSLARVLKLYGLDVSEAPLYTALEEIRDEIEDQARTEVSTDPPDRSYFETGYGSAARITRTELVILPSSERPRYYSLTSITHVRRTALPAGQSAVVITTSGGQDSPGLTFSCAETAAAFANALTDAGGTSGAGNREEDCAADEGGLDTPEADALANHEARKGGL